MNNKMKIFENADYGKLRTFQKEGEIWFVAKDLARALGYRDAHNMNRMLDDDEKGMQSMSTPGGTQHMSTINESGVYHSIMKSRQDNAKQFRRWVTKEVLPSIRRDGGYIVTKDDESEQELMARALKVADRTLQRVREREKKLIAARKKDKPKVDFYNTVTKSPDAIEMGKVAKVLKVPGYGRNNLFAFLRERGILMHNNLPYQSFVDRGYFRVVEQPYTDGKGNLHINVKTLVYQKGIDYIRKILIAVTGKN